MKSQLVVDLIENLRLQYPPKESNLVQRVEESLNFRGVTSMGYGDFLDLVDECLLDGKPPLVPLLGRTDTPPTVLDYNLKQAGASLSEQER